MRTTEWTDRHPFAASLLGLLGGCLWVGALLGLILFAQAGVQR